MERYICIHGHFYQPPRENPWLEAVETQESAYPYHDWNERVTAECYGPNATARILDGESRIADIVNNYPRISFNFGPTLLSWMREHAQETYRAILDADRESQERFGGHGSAMAQAYNHVIMPLATRADKVTQVRWGVQDFVHRFGRQPEGLWLPETAVDLETLEVLAEHDLRFTVLAPHQAARVRPVAGGEWADVSGGRVDPSRAYEVHLPSGRTLALFFYDGPVSQAIAFERLLQNGDRFVRRLEGAFVEGRDWPQLVHVATDGESYGHHHDHGEMALAYALEQIERAGTARLTNYGEFLERHPPTHEVTIIEQTSWSCAHGVERWRSDCGCRTGGDRRWNQGWRAPLREALESLRQRLAPLYEERARQLLKDPWGARDDYVTVVLDRSPETVEAFLQRWAGRTLSTFERMEVLKLLELQRHAQLMFTSCGWFFEELSGVETVQVIQYAGRALQLGEELFGEDLEPVFLEELAQAKSNLAEHQDGRRIYEKWVRPSRVDLLKVGGHYAVGSVFEEGTDEAQVYCYTVQRHDHRVLKVGNATLAVGQATVTSAITGESLDESFAVVHLGDHNVSGGVRPFRGGDAYAVLARELTDAFKRADFPETLRLVDQHLEGSTQSLRSLFRDVQLRVVASLLEATMVEVETVYRDVHERHGPLMRFLTWLGFPSPRGLLVAAELVLNAEIRRALEQPAPDIEQVRSLLDAARDEGIRLDHAGLAFAYEQGLERLGEEVRARPTELEALARLEAARSLGADLPFEVDPWRLENLCHAMARSTYLEQVARAARGEGDTRAWVDTFRRLANLLRIRID